MFEIIIHFTVLNTVLSFLDKISPYKGCKEKAFDIYGEKALFKVFQIMLFKKSMRLPIWLGKYFLLIKCFLKKKNEFLEMLYFGFFVFLMAILIKNESSSQTRVHLSNISMNFKC